MPYAKLKAEILVARERREAALLETLARNHQTMLQLALNLPGADKQPSGSPALFDWGESQLKGQLQSLHKLAQNLDILGNWALYSVDMPAQQIKKRTVMIEELQPAGRLLDIDVYDKKGKACDRTRMGLHQRRCLLCHEAARDCIRTKNHTAQQLRERVDELLIPFRA